MITIVDVLKRFYPNTEWGCDENTYAGLHWVDKKQTKPTEAEIQAKIAELQAAEPMRQLRIQRNQLLQQTDWRMTSDYPYTDQSAWATYRTALRNLPATASPTLDENGNLTNVVWPTPPSDL